MFYSPLNSFKSLCSCLIGLAVVVGLANVAKGQGPPPRAPFGDIQATLGIILDRLDDLQDDVDNLQGALGPCEVPPVWGKKFSAADRFVEVLDGDAYCDQETGQVWDRIPDNGTTTWIAAFNNCAFHARDGRKGWALPTVWQLSSLADLLTTEANQADALNAPNGPFSNVQPLKYWSATTVPQSQGLALVVDFGTTNALVSFRSKGLTSPVWCVRAGPSSDGNTHDTLH